MTDRWPIWLLVLAVVLIAVTVSRCLPSVLPAEPVTPTPTFAVTVLPSSTAAPGLPASPSPTASATPSLPPGASPGAVVVGETRIPTPTPTMTRTATLTPSATPTMGTSVPVQKG